MGSGNDLLLKIELVRDSGTFTTVGGLQTKSAKINHEVVEITNHGSNLFRQLLEGAGVKSVDLSGEGYYDDSDTVSKLQENSLAGTFMNCQIIDPVTNRKIEGLFAIPTVDWSADMKKEQRYAASFQSSGEVLITEV